MAEHTNDGLNLVNAEAQVRAAFPSGTVIQAAKASEDELLLVVRTGRKYGYFAVIVFGVSADGRPGLYTGHYFDSLTETKADFNTRRQGEPLYNLPSAHV